MKKAISLETIIGVSVISFLVIAIAFTFSLTCMKASAITKPGDIAEPNELISGEVEGLYSVTSRLHGERWYATVRFGNGTGKTNVRVPKEATTYLNVGYTTNWKVNLDGSGLLWAGN